MCSMDILRDIHRTLPHGIRHGYPIDIINVRINILGYPFTKNRTWISIARMDIHTDISMKAMMSTYGYHH